MARANIVSVGVVSRALRSSELRVGKAASSRIPRLGVLLLCAIVEAAGCLFVAGLDKDYFDANQCTVATDCPGWDEPCRHRQCDDGLCRIAFVPANEQVPSQKVGDCLEVVCDGKGGLQSNPADDPADDNNPCTKDICDNGTPVHDRSPYAPCVMRSGEPGRCNMGGIKCFECVENADCATTPCGADCVCRHDAGHACYNPASCGDGIADGNETDVDCGGPGCDKKCAVGQKCGMNTDCSSGHCDSGHCVAASCSDGIADGDETDVDCGGQTCPPCGPGKGCDEAGDCDVKTGGCIAGHCAASSCTDGILDGDETDVDCGGTTCSACLPGKSCKCKSDCVPGTYCCAANVAQSGHCSTTVCPDPGPCK